MTPPPLILVVEDNQPLRRMVALTLTSAGYRIAEASDGHEALDQARRQLPAAVLTDLMLPDIDGEQLLVQLRDLPGARELPVIAMSLSRTRLSAIAGAPAFTESLVKPVASHMLVETLERHAPRQSSEALGLGRTLLLVDDNPVQRKLFSLQLERLGFDVTTAANGVEALRAAQASPPDVIVSDVLMPEPDGFELCRAIRADPRLGTVPVVLMTAAYVDEADRRLAERTGVTAYLERGPDTTELERALASCLSSQPPAPPRPFPTFEIEHARRVRSQLEQQAAANRALGERLELKNVEMSVVAGVASVITRSMGAAQMLQEALTRCLEVAGVSAGAVWLTGVDGELERVATAGAAENVAGLCRSVEHRRIETELSREAGLMRLPPDATGSAGVAAALATSGTPLGAIALSWHDASLDEQRVGFVRTIAGQLSEAVAVRQAIGQLDSSREETITRLALAAEFRDNDTARHTERVSLYSQLLAERLGFGSARAEAIRIASVMHDVGKIGVSDTILLKPGPLTADEFEQMKLHTTFGHRILGNSGVELLDLAALIALTHHERMDGSGYPAGLRGGAIPIEGRIVAVADVFDALTSRRVYRYALTVDSAIETMRAGRGTLFDAQVLDSFVSGLDDILAIRAVGATAASGRARDALSADPA
jgi:response regulator RpfG family c-di-GMP phosphodiesterase